MKATKTIPSGSKQGLQEILQASFRGLTLCFPGVGSAFSKKNDQTSLIIAKNGKSILVDMGVTIPKSLATRGISTSDFDYYHVTHSHADHIGGLEELLLLSRYGSSPKPKMIITESYQEILWNGSLRGGCEHNETGLLKFTDLVFPIRPSWVKSQPREMYQMVVGGIHLLIFRTMHIPGGSADWEKAFWSTGLLIDGKVLFSGDTRFDPSLFMDLPLGDVEAIFHDCQLFNPGTVHASYDELKSLPLDIRSKIHLIHYGDTFETIDPTADGFVGFTMPWVIYQNTPERFSQHIRRFKSTRGSSAREAMAA